MKCSETRDKLGFYLDGTLGEHTLEQVEEHLAGCAQCREEMNRLKSMLQATAGLESVEPPVSLRNAIMQAAQEAQVCRQVFPLLSRFIDSDLASEAHAFVRAHVGECKACAQELQAIKAAAAAAGLIDQVEPPANLRARIAAAVAGQRTSLRGRLIEVFSARAIRWTGAAAAAVLVLGIMFTIPHATRQVNRAVTGQSKPTSIASIGSKQPASAVSIGKQSGKACVSEFKHRRVKRHIVMVAAAPKPKPIMHKIAFVPPVHVETETPSAPQVQSAPAPVADTNADKNVNLTKAPAPTTKAETVNPKLVRVAAAVMARHNVSEWFKEAKMEAAMHKGSDAGVTLISTRF